MFVEEHLKRKSGMRYSADLMGADSIKWCNETFGPQGSLVGSRWYALQYTIQFQNEEDRLWYILRWGQGA